MLCHYMLHSVVLQHTALHHTCIRAAVIAVSAKAATSILILFKGALKALAASCKGLRNEPARGEKEGKSSCSVLLEVLLA
jgi:hypothetical protein